MPRRAIRPACSKPQVVVVAVWLVVVRSGSTAALLIYARHQRFVWRLKYGPTMSISLSTNRESRLSLKVSSRCGWGFLALRTRGLEKDAPDLTSSPARKMIWARWAEPNTAADFWLSSRAARWPLLGGQDNRYARLRAATLQPWTRARSLPQCL